MLSMFCVLIICIVVQVNRIGATRPKSNLHIHTLALDISIPFDCLLYLHQFHTSL